MTLPEKARRLAEKFSIFHDPHERLAAVVDRARRIPTLTPDQRVAANRVPGCVSVVWLASELRDGRCHFRVDAESPMVRGLVAFLADFFSGATPADIAACEIDPLEELHLIQNLSPTRRNGLASTRAAIRDFAQKHAGSATSP